VLGLALHQADLGRPDAEADQTLLAGRSPHE
jgi:hypothetical protein